MISCSKVFACVERGVHSAVCGRERNELTIAFFVVLAFNFVFHMVIKVYKKTLVEPSELHLDSRFTRRRCYIYNRILGAF